MLDARKELAIQLMLDGRLNKTQIAKEVGLYSRQTIYDWLKDEEFKAELDRRKAEIVDSGVQMIASKFVDSIVGYWKLIENTNNDNVAAEGYRYFIDRKLGKPKSSLDITAEAKQEAREIKDEDFDEWDQLEANVEDGESAG